MSVALNGRTESLDYPGKQFLIFASLLTGFTVSALGLLTGAYQILKNHMEFVPAIVVSGIVSILVILIIGILYQQIQLFKLRQEVRS